MAKKDSGAPRDVREAAQKIWMAGLGALKVAEEEGSKLFKRLVEQGEHFEERGRENLGKIGASARVAAGKVREGADETFDRLGRTFDEKLADTLKRLGVPSRDEIQRLSSRVEELTRAVDRMRGGPARPKPSAAAAGAAPKAAAKPRAAKPKSAKPKSAKPKSAAPKAAAKPKATASKKGAAKPATGGEGSSGGTT